MRILYHMTSPAPLIPGADAVFQEAGSLQRACGGEAINLYPFKLPIKYYPRSLYGAHCLDRLIRLDRDVDLHHVFFSDLAFFPALRLLKKPIVYSVIATVQVKQKPEIPGNAHIVVNNERDRDRLESWGLANYTFIRPGIDISWIVPSHVPIRDSFTLLAGSPPWVKPQLKQKGFEALLDTVRRMPSLRLVCLWRGVLYDEFMKMIEDRGIADRVEVVNEKADVNELLQRVHAAVVLADDPGIVKAYPHSLLEALAAGKPVIASSAIPISDYVERNGCGRRVNAIIPGAIVKAVRDIIADYDAFRARALSAGRRDFSMATMIASHRRLYESIIKKPCVASAPTAWQVR